MGPLDYETVGQCIVKGTDYAACVAAINTGSATAARPRAGNHCRGSSYGHHRDLGVG